MFLVIVVFVVVHLFFRMKASSLSLCFLKLALLKISPFLLSCVPFCRMLNSSVCGLLQGLGLLLNIHLMSLDFKQSDKSVLPAIDLEIENI